MNAKALDLIPGTSEEREEEINTGRREEGKIVKDIHRG